MENIHIIDEEMFENLKNMFNSNDVENIKMGLFILNNSDHSNKTIIEKVGQLMSECHGLCFSVFLDKNNNKRVYFNWKGDIYVNDDDDSLLEYEPFIDNFDM